jgi:hypothetical protein
MVAAMWSMEPKGHLNQLAGAGSSIAAADGDGSDAEVESIAILRSIGAGNR